MWHKLTHNETGELYYSASLDGIDVSQWNALPIVGDRCPESYEEVDEAGNIFEPLEPAKERRRAAVTAIKDTKQASLAATSFGIVQNDAKSKTLMNGAVSMALVAKTSGQPFSITWTMADNSEVTLSADQMIQMGVETGSYVDAVQQYSNSLKAQINAASSIAEISAIDIEAGWP